MKKEKVKPRQRDRLRMFFGRDDAEMSRFFSYLCIEITGGGGIAEAFVKVFCETDVYALSNPLKTNY